MTFSFRSTSTTTTTTSTTTKKPTTTTTTTTSTTSTTTTTTSTTTTTTTTLPPVTLKENSLTMTYGEQYTIVPSRSDVTYQSNNKAVAIVSDKGVIITVGTGNAIISVIDSDSNVAQLKLTVIEKLSENDSVGIITFDDAIRDILDLADVDTAKAAIEGINQHEGWTAVYSPQGGYRDRTST